MGSTTELGFGWVTPALSYILACLGAALGLRCTVRALSAAGRSRRNWLLMAALAIGVGIWTMHFVAMLGFSVTGTAIRYDPLLTAASLVASVVVVGFGVLVVGYGRSRVRSLLVGGLITGIGVSAMHYLGMSAMHVTGTVAYDTGTVALSVAIAVVAATAALWASVTIRTATASLGASLVMGVAVSAMHYTGMAAARFHVDQSGPPPSGVSGTEFAVPMIVILGSYLFLASAFVALSTTAQERSASEAIERLSGLAPARAAVSVPFPGSGAAGRSRNTSTRRPSDRSAEAE